MDKYTERLFDNTKNKLDEIYSLVEDYANELSSLQDKYDSLEKDYEELEKDFEYYKINLDER